MAAVDEVAYGTMADLAARIRRREVSPGEVRDATIERIEERNPSINAFVHLAFDEAQQRVRAGAVGYHSPRPRRRRPQ